MMKFETPFSVLMLVALVMSSCASEMTSEQYFSALLVNTPKLDLSEVDIDAYRIEGRTGYKSADHAHSAIVSYYTEEYWAAVLEQNPALSTQLRERMLEPRKGLQTISIMQLDLDSSSPVPKISGYTRDEVARGMTLEYVNSSGTRYELAPLNASENDEDRILADKISQVDRAQAGVGAGTLHVFVVDNRMKQAVSPYDNGVLFVTLTDRSGLQYSLEIEFPYSSLFEKRKCPGNDEIKMRWRYCPRSGEEVPLPG